MIITKLDIPCVWNGTLTGVLLRNDEAATGKFGEKTIKIVGIHGWLDNLNSMLPLARKLIDRHPNYEIYLYDRAGHGFSSHVPKGFEYSSTQNLRDLRTVIQTLGWNKEKIITIGHSYGAMLGLIYAASYSNEVLCHVALDALPRRQATVDNYFRVLGSRIDASLQFHNTPPRIFDTELTFENAMELTKVTRTNITDEAARLLTERSVRRDVDNKLHFTRDESLKMAEVTPFSEELLRASILSLKAFVLFIGATNPQWPRDPEASELLKAHHSTFEMTLIDGPHHLHMTHVDEVAARIEQYFDKYLSETKSQL